MLGSAQVPPDQWPEWVRGPSPRAACRTCRGSLDGWRAPQPSAIERWDDKAFGPGASLACIGQPSDHGTLNRLAEVGIVKNHENVASTQFKGRFLQHLGGARRPGSAMVGPRGTEFHKINIIAAGSPTRIPRMFSLGVANRKTLNESDHGLRYADRGRAGTLSSHHRLAVCDCGKHPFGTEVNYLPPHRAIPSCNVR